MVTLLSEKQEEVLKSINRFGIITSTQLSKFLKGRISHVSVYAAIEKLKNLGFIESEKHGKNLIIYMKPSGVSYLGSNLTPFRNINYSQLKHQLVMNDCILGMKNFFLRKEMVFKFQTERELRSRFIETNFSKSQKRDSTLIKKIPDRIPDFVVMEEDKKIAYEVELSQKSGKRYIQKMNMYHSEILSGRYQRVRYLCESSHIRNVVAKYAKQEQLNNQHMDLTLVKEVISIG